MSAVDESVTRAVPRQARSARSIDQILDAAQRVAARHGVQALSTISVAAEAGVSVGKVYYWFEDKQALIEAVESRTQDEFTVFLEATLAEAVELSTPQLVERFFRSFIEFMVDNPGSLALLDRRQATAGTAGIDHTNPAPYREYMVSLIGGLITLRVEGSTTREQKTVAEVLTAITVAMTFEILDAPAADREEITVEALYLAVGYLAARYPTADDPVWEDTSRHIRPARPSNAETVIHDHVHPAAFD